MVSGLRRGCGDMALEQPVDDIRNSGVAYENRKAKLLGNGA
jgi:hypothetical protein